MNNALRLAVTDSTQHETLYKTTHIEGLKIFFREAGDKQKPTIVLLHGFPTSSHMFRNLIPLLSKDYHVVAPDYPGFGYSDAPSVAELDYSFDHLSLIVDQFLEKQGIDKYSLYMMDYGAPIGFRIAVKHPERIQTLVIQNGNAYEEGINNDAWNPLKALWADPSEANTVPLAPMFEAGTTQWQYTHGVGHPDTISPDTWTLDQALLDRPGNKAIQLALFKSYGSNPPRYPEWQAYFRQHQPPTLIEWGKNDPFFGVEGAEAYKRDLKTVEFHLLDSGHFALEEYTQQIGADILRFLHKYFSYQN